MDAIMMKKASAPLTGVTQGVFALLDSLFSGLALSV
jgi:hypothetical protein